VGLAIKLLDF